MRKFTIISRIVLIFFVVCLIITIVATLLSNGETTIVLPNAFGVSLLVSAALSILIMLIFFALEVREQWEVSGVNFLYHMVVVTLCMWLVFWGLSVMIEGVNRPIYCLAIAVAIQVGSKAIERIFQKHMH